MTEDEYFQLGLVLLKEQTAIIKKYRGPLVRLDQIKKEINQLEVEWRASKKAASSTYPNP